MDNDFGTTEKELTNNLKELVALACKPVAFAGTMGAALTLQGGSGAIAGFVTGTAALAPMLPALIAGAVLGVLVGRLVCPTLSKEMVERLQAQVTGDQPLTTIDAQLLQGAVERQLGMTLNTKDFNSGLAQAATALKHGSTRLTA